MKNTCFCTVFRRIFPTTPQNAARFFQKMRCNKRIYKGNPGSQIDLIFVKNVFLAFQPFKRLLKLKFSKISDVGVTPPAKLSA